MGPHGLTSRPGPHGLTSRPEPHGLTSRPGPHGLNLGLRLFELWELWFADILYVFHTRIHMYM